MSDLHLALALLVTRVGLADDHDVAVAADHLAVIADRLDAGVDLHDVASSLAVIVRLISVVEPVETKAVTFQQSLLVAVDDAAAGQVVGAQLYDHAVLREDADVVLAHLARDVGEHLVAVGQLNAEHCVGQSFDYCAFDLDDTVFFGHSLFVANSGLLVVRIVMLGCRPLTARKQ